MKKRYTKKLIIALVVIALFAITMVCCMAFVMPKNEDISTGAVATSSDSVDSGRYPIYTESNTIIESENFSDSTSFTSLLTKEIGNDFMYYIHINANVTNNYEFLPFSLDVICDEESNEGYFNLEINDNKACIMKYADSYEKLMNENYDIYYENTIDLTDNIYDYFIVISPDSIDFCYYMRTGQGDNNQNKFEVALKHKAISISKAEDYNILFNFFKKVDLYISYRLTPNQYPSGQTEMYYPLTITQKLIKYSEFNIPPREGYTFKGLYYDEAFTQPYTGDPVKPLEELYQKWEINTYTVTFDWRDDENWQYDTPISKTYKYGEEIDFVPEREYYGFIGWFDDATGQAFDGVVKSDLYLIGKWDKYHVFVTYMDTDLSILNTEQLFMGEIARWIPRKVGYKFKYWTLNGEIYEDINAPLMQNTTLVANFEKIDCTITLFINNNVYKAYKVDYDLPLLDFLNEIGIKKNFVAKYAFTDLTGSNTPINELSITKDMRVDLSDSYIIINNIKEEVKSNSKLIAIVVASIGVLILVSILGAIFGGKKKKRKR